MDVANSTSLCEASKIVSACVDPGVLAPLPGPFSSCRVQTTTVECNPSEVSQCALANGRGTRVCSAAGAWGSCKPTLCNFGYQMDSSNQTCVPASCAAKSESYCSANTTDSLMTALGAGICNDNGVATASCQHLKCLDPAINTSTNAQTNCAVTCVAGSVRDCSDMNGKGTQTCLPGGTAYSSCSLSSCDEGYVFDSKLKICVANSCSAGSAVNCKTQMGLDGVYNCQSNNRFSVICEPLTCPEGFERKTISGYAVCAVKLCAADELRNAAGKCAKVVATPTPTPTPTPVPTPIPTPTPMPAKNCVVNGQSVSAGAFDVSNGFKSSHVPYGSVCQADNYSGSCNGETGIATFTKVAAASSCVVDAAKQCALASGRVVNGGAFTDVGYQSATVPYGNTCVRDDASGVCDPGTGLATYAHRSNSLSCVVQGAVACVLENGVSVSTPTFSVAGGFKSSLVRTGTACSDASNLDSYQGTCDLSSGAVTYSHKPATLSCNVDPSATCSFRTGSTNLLVSEILNVWATTTNTTDLQYSKDGGNTWQSFGLSTVLQSPIENSVPLMLSAGSYTLMVRAINPTGVPSTCNAGMLQSVPVNVMSGAVNFTSLNFAQNNSASALVSSSENVQQVQINCSGAWVNLSTTNGNHIFAPGYFAPSNYNCQIQVVNGGFARILPGTIDLRVSPPFCPGTAPSKFGSCSAAITGANVGNYTKYDVTCPTTSTNWSQSLIASPDLSVCACHGPYTKVLTGSSEPFGYCKAPPTSAGEHCDIGGPWGWRAWGETCPNGTNPVDPAAIGGCPDGFTYYSAGEIKGCYISNSDPRRPAGCATANPRDECCMLTCSSSAPAPRWNCIRDTIPNGDAGPMPAGTCGCGSQFGQTTTVPWITTDTKCTAYSSEGDCISWQEVGHCASP